MNTINSLIDSRYLKICFHAVLTVLVIAAIGLLAYTSSELLFKVKTMVRVKFYEKILSL